MTRVEEGTETMSDTAKRAADFFTRATDTIYHGAIYDDGIILYLCVGDETAKKWVEAWQATAQQWAKLEKGAKLLQAIEYARSTDGLVWAFILRGLPEALAVKASLLGETIHSDWSRWATLQDNQDRDHDTIDSFLALIKEV
jgi:hypothetical protein